MKRISAFVWGRATFPLGESTLGRLADFLTAYEGPCCLQSRAMFELVELSLRVKDRLPVVTGTKGPLAVNNAEFRVSAPVRKHISCAALINIGRCGFGRASTRGRGCGM